MGIRSVLVSALILTAAAAPRAQRVYLPGEPGVSTPVLVERAKAEYTPEAWQHKIEGSVWLECDVLPDGTAGAIAVTRTFQKDTYGLDEQAVLALQRWKFRPGAKDGTPITVRVNVEIKFTLARRPPA
jgi:TonB family protein